MGYQWGDKGVFGLFGRIVGRLIGGRRSKLLVDAPAHDILERELGTEDIERPLSKHSLEMTVSYLQIALSDI